MCEKLSKPARRERRGFKKVFSFRRCRRRTYAKATRNFPPFPAMWTAFLPPRSRRAPWMTLDHTGHDRRGRGDAAQQLAFRSRGKKWKYLGGGLVVVVVVVDDEVRNHGTKPWLWVALRPPGRHRHSCPPPTRGSRWPLAPLGSQHRLTLTQLRQLRWVRADIFILKVRADIFLFFTNGRKIFFPDPRFWRQGTSIHTSGRTGRGVEWWKSSIRTSLSW